MPGSRLTGLCAGKSHGLAICDHGEWVRIQKYCENSAGVNPRLNPGQLSKPYMHNIHARIPPFPWQFPVASGVAYRLVARAMANLRLPRKYCGEPRPAARGRPKSFQSARGQPRLTTFGPLATFNAPAKFAPTIWWPHPGMRVNGAKPDKKIGAGPRGNGERFVTDFFAMWPGRSGLENPNRSAHRPPEGGASAPGKRNKPRGSRARGVSTRKFGRPASLTLPRSKRVIEEPEWMKMRGAPAKYY